jgi:hypothetical protein
VANDQRGGELASDLAVNSWVGDGVTIEDTRFTESVSLRLDLKKELTRHSRR